MARMGRRMLAPINTRKHFIGQTLGNVASGTVSTRVVAEGVAAPATANAFSVREGSVIKAVFIELWLTGDGNTGVESSFQVTLEKINTNQPGLTLTDALNLTLYENKRNILYTTQGAVSPAINGQSTIPILKQWFKIPKGKQRMALGDKIVLNIASLAIQITICGIFIYKEYE